MLEQRREKLHYSNLKLQDYSVLTMRPLPTGVACPGRQGPIFSSGPRRRRTSWSLESALAVTGSSGGADSVYEAHPSHGSQESLRGVHELEI
jgi:hypothetical protein